MIYALIIFIITAIMSINMNISLTYAEYVQSIGNSPVAIVMAVTFFVLAILAASAIIVCFKNRDWMETHRFVLGLCFGFLSGITAIVEGIIFLVTYIS